MPSCSGAGILLAAHFLLLPPFPPILLVVLGNVVEFSAGDTQNRNIHL